MSLYPEIKWIESRIGKWELVYRYVFGVVTMSMFDRTTGESFTRDWKGYHKTTESELNTLNQFEEFTST